MYVVQDVGKNTPKLIKTCLPNTDLIVFMFDIFLIQTFLIFGVAYNLK